MPVTSSEVKPRFREPLLGPAPVQLGELELRRGRLGLPLGADVLLHEARLPLGSGARHLRGGQRRQVRGLGLGDGGGVHRRQRLTRLHHLAHVHPHLAHDARGQRRHPGPAVAVVADLAEQGQRGLAPAGGGPLRAHPRQVGRAGRGHADLQRLARLELLRPLRLADAALGLGHAVLVAEKSGRCGGGFSLRLIGIGGFRGRGRSGASAGVAEVALVLVERVLRAPQAVLPARAAVGRASTGPRSGRARCTTGGRPRALMGRR